MPTLDEMKVSLEMIREHCRKHSGKHAQVLAELGERLSRQELRDDFEGQREQYLIKTQYEDAISTLLSLAMPASKRTLERTLKRLGELTGEPLSEVQVLDVDGEQPVEEYRVSEALPKPRRMTKLNEAILREFQEHLPRKDWQRWLNPPQGRSN